MDGSLAGQTQKIVDTPETDPLKKGRNGHFQNLRTPGPSDIEQVGGKNVGMSEKAEQAFISYLTHGMKSRLQCTDGAPARVCRFSWSFFQLSWSFSLSFSWFSLALALHRNAGETIF